MRWCHDVEAVGTFRLAHELPHGQTVEGGENKAVLINIHLTQIKRGSPLTKECIERRLVILWVRDPVQRFISSFLWTVESRTRMRGLQRQQNLDQTRLADLNYMVSTVVADGRDVTAANFIRHVWHGGRSLSWYFDGDCSIFDDMPNIFVGRMEYYNEDYESLLEVMNYSAKNKILPSIHKTKRTGVNASRGTIDFLRGLEQTKGDYKCLQKLVDKCLLSQDYVDQMRQRLSYSM